MIKPTHLAWTKSYASKHAGFLTTFSSVRFFHRNPRLHQVTLLIKAEHPDRLWERRTPLIPDHVRQLTEKFGNWLTVKVESSQKRFFDDQSYCEAGAELISAGKGDGDIIIAVKEIAIADLPDRTNRPPRTYLFFSHTHKGQSYNIALLNRMVNCGDHFIDWELLLNPLTATREVSFGRLAGVVGGGEALSGYGLFALKQGFSTPFLNLPRPYTFESTDDFFSGLQRLRSRISNEGYRGPLVSVVVSGSTGRVGKGVVETFDRVGVEWVDNLAQLQDGISRSENLKRHNKVLGYKSKLEDYVVHRSTKRNLVFDRASYNAHPDLFRSVFHETVAPWTTLLVNGAYWSSEFPRILSNHQLAKLLKQPKHRLKGVVDVSCDYNGGLEFVDRATTIEAPYAYFKYDQARSTLMETKWDDPETQLQLVSIEILPSELARNASDDFSSAALPYLTALIQSKMPGMKVDNPELLSRLENGMICGDGKLMSQHESLGLLLLGPPSPQRIENSKERLEVSEGTKKVVVFGSGLVARPAVETLLQSPNIEVIIAAKVVEEANSICAQICAKDPSTRPRIRIVQVDLDALSNRTELSKLIKEANVVISLLPATMHPKILAACLEESVNLVTASYVSPAMAEFHDAAISKNLIFLNELGLDPGIDHMTAIRLIQRLKRDEPRSRIRSFVSFCGGLPESSDGLLGYRFSWSPKGVLLATGNPARFILGGKKFEVSGEYLLQRNFPEVGNAMFGGKFKEGNLALEGLANRDSLGYIDRYGLDEQSIETMLRGTLRFKGFCKVMDVLKRIGLLREGGHVRWGKAGPPRKWNELIEKMEVKIEDARVKQVLGGLGLLPGSETSSKSTIEMPSEAEMKQMAPIDLLCKFLSHRLQYGPNERDLVLMTHEIRIESQTGGQRIVKSELIASGDRNNSAMAKTVGSPVAIGAIELLKQSSRFPKGVIRPIEESVWEAILNRLELECQLKMVEHEYDLSEAQAQIGGGLETILSSAVSKWQM